MNILRIFYLITIIYGFFNIFAYIIIILLSKYTKKNPKQLKIRDNLIIFLFAVLLIIILALTFCLRFNS
jgi:hypothetical protein